MRGAKIDLGMPVLIGLGCGAVGVICLLATAAAVAWRLL